MDIFVGTVLTDNEQRIFLIKERDANQINKDRWNLPGGRLENEEAIYAAAERETREETGFESNIVSVLGIYQAKTSNTEWMYIVFGATQSGPQSRIVDSNVLEGQWFDRDEFLDMEHSKLVHSDMKIVYKKHIAGEGVNFQQLTLLALA